MHLQLPAIGGGGGGGAFLDVAPGAEHPRYTTGSRPSLVPIAASLGASSALILQLAGDSRPQHCHFAPAIFEAGWYVCYQIRMYRVWERDQQKFD